jgi:hypothetical protein
MTALRGLTAVAFKCPQCGGDRWGTRGIIGVCHGRAFISDACGYTWVRLHDYRVFVRISSGVGFASPAELDLCLDGGVPTSPTPPMSFPETLHELLACVMARPPTVAVVALWSRREQRAALNWASGQILAEEDPMRPIVERPPFIEDGAATA